MKKQLFSIAVMAIMTINGISQTLQWVNQIGNDSPGGNGTGYTNGEYGTVVRTDATGNVYIAGGFCGTNVDFDPSMAIDLFSNGVTGSDIFLSKYDNTGNYLWTKVMHGITSGSNLSLARDLEIDSEGNIILTGTFLGTFDFNPSTVATNNLTSNGTLDIFVAKYTSGGEYVWAFNIGSNQEELFPRIALDSDNNIYLSGAYSGTMNFDPMGLHQMTALNYASFIARYSSTGALTWVRQFDGAQDDYVTDIAVSGNHVYSCGYFYGTCNFSQFGGPVNLTSVGYEDAFITKYDLNGTFVFAKQLAGSYNDRTGRIQVKNGKIYCSGRFNGNLDFDPGIDNFSLTTNGNDDGFICVLTDQGEFSTVHRIGGIGNDLISEFIVDENDMIYASGQFQQSVNFNTTNLSTTGSNGVFIAKISPNSELYYDWVAGFTGSGTVICPSITLDNSGNIYTLGYFTGTIDFDPGPGVVNLTATGSSTYDIFFHKLGDCPSINPLVNQSGSILTSAQDAADSYQWVDCANNNAPIAGATNQSFTPNQNGSYAVQISYGTCSIISECINVTVGTNSITEESSNTIQVYPNPTTSSLNFKGIEHGQIEIMATNGQIVYSAEILTSNSIDVSHLHNGIYIVRITNENGLFQTRFIKE